MGCEVTPTLVGHGNPKVRAVLAQPEPLAQALMIWSSWEWISCSIRDLKGRSIMPSSR